MEPLQINISAKALDYLEKRLEFSRDPHVIGMLPVLFHMLDSRTEDKDGTTIQFIPYEHFQLVWCHPEDLGEHQEVEVAGSKVMIHPTSLQGLAGKRLELRIPDAVRPDDKDENILVPVPMTS